MLQFSLEASLSDPESSDTVLEVTTVTKYVMRYIKRITVVRHISNDNQVLQEKKSEVGTGNRLLISTHQQLTFPAILLIITVMLIIIIIITIMNILLGQL